jgi:Tfp pilus assembly major pilin PilA
MLLVMFYTLLVLQVYAAEEKENFEKEVKEQWKIANKESYETPEKIVSEGDAKDDKKLNENCEKVKISVLNAAIGVHTLAMQIKIDRVKELEENLGITSEIQKESNFDAEVKEQWLEVQTEGKQINYDLTNLQKVITQSDFQTCARKVHQNMLSSVYASHVKLMNEIQKKIEELELKKLKKDEPRNDFLKKVKEKWVQEAKDKNYSTVPNYEKPQELCTAFGYNTSDATIRTASERNRDVMLSSAIKVYLEMTNVKRNELIQLQNTHTGIPLKVSEEEQEKEVKHNTQLLWFFIIRYS